MGLIALLIFGFALTLALGLSSLPARAPVRRRLARLADGSAIPSSAAQGLLRGDDRGLLVRLLSPFAGRGGDGATPRRQRQRLIEAGYRRDSALTVYTGSRVALSLLLPLLLPAAPPVWALEQLQLVVLLCTAAAAGLVGPSQWLDRKRAQRKTKILNGLPDALDLMVVCVEAGLGINASLARIAREFARSNPTLSAEFELVNLEIRAGKSTTQALRALADRTGVSEVGSLVALLVQTERFGTSVADALRVHAEGLRVQRMQRAEEQAGKAPLKMLFPTLVIFAATLIVTLGPGLLQLMSFFEAQAN